MIFSKKPERSVRGHSIALRLLFIQKENLNWDKITKGLSNFSKDYLLRKNPHDTFENTFPNADQLFKSIATIDWYPCEVYNELIESSTKVMMEHGLSAIDINRAAGRFSAQYHFNSSLSFILSLGSIPLTLTLVYKGWEQLFSGGEVVVLRNVTGTSEAIVKCNFITPLMEHIIYGVIEEFMIRKNIKEYRILSSYSDQNGGAFFFKGIWS